MILGIDPGLNGCLVLIEGDQIATVLHMPVIKTAQGNKEVNSAAIHAWLSCFPIDHAYLEKVHAMPGQGVVSMFTFGRAVGMIEGVLQSLGLGYDLVTPREWKAHFSLLSQDKDASRQKAKQMFDHPDLAKKAKGQAIADAAFIGLYGRDRHAKQAS